MDTSKRAVPLLAASTAIIGLAVAAVLGWSERGNPEASTAVEHGLVPELEQARKLVAELARTEPLKPYGLVASVPPRSAGWKCELGHWTVATWCNRGRNRPGYRNPPGYVRWSIDEEQDAFEVDARIASAERAARERDAGRRRQAVARVELAGFLGYVSAAALPDAGSRTWDFVGWFEDARRGRLRLTVTAYTDDGTRVDALAVLLSTRPVDGKPPGPGSSWPSEEERVRARDFERAVATLDDVDSSRRDWEQAVEALVKLDASKPLPDRAELVARIKGRIDDPGHASFGAARSAAKLERALRQLSPVDADAALESLARVVRTGEVAARSTSLASAAHWLNLDCELSARQAEAGEGTAMPALARRLRRTSDETLELATTCHAIFEKPNPDLQQALGERLLKVRLAALEDDWVEIARLTSAEVRRLPAARRLYLTRLRDRRPHGEIESTHVDAIMRTPDGSYRVAVEHPASLPNHGTVQRLRVCDHFAMALHEEAGIAQFDPFLPVAARDQLIREIAAWLGAYQAGVR